MGLGDIGNVWSAPATENLALMMIETETTKAIALLEDSIACYRALDDPIGTEALNNATPYS